MRVRTCLAHSWTAVHVTVCLLAWSFLTVVPADAHGVHVQAWTEGNTIHTLSTRSGNRRVKGGLVEVLDAAGAKLLQGNTDGNGAFSFPRPLQGDLRIVLTAGAGHRAVVMLKQAGAPKDASGIPAGKSGDSAGGHPALPEEEAPDWPFTRTDIKSIDVRLDAIESRLTVLTENKGPGITEILGGIGYIFGLMGVALYFRSKKSAIPVPSLKPPAH